MRILILGCGMLGHKIFQTLSSRFEIWITSRQTSEHSAGFFGKQLITGVDAFNPEVIRSVLDETQPEALINCIGLVKQLPEASDPSFSFRVNSAFPRELAEMCATHKIRMLHISTDCVFSGKTGSYTENDVPDPIDLYGRSKLLGEIQAPGCLTIRTSAVGRQLRGSHGLVEWALSRTGAVDGFTNAVFSGFSTTVLARIIAGIFENHKTLDGLVHIASNPISKYDLLCLLKKHFKIPIDIAAQPEPRINRSLDGSYFNAITGFVSPSWSDMVEEMAADPTPYSRWRNF